MDPIDKTVLESLKSLQEEGEPDIVKELIELYLEDSKLQLSSIRAGIIEKNYQNLRVAAHTLKGSCQNFGAKKLGAICFEIEEKARSGSIEGANEILGRLELEFDKVQKALELELHS